MSKVLELLQIMETDIPYVQNALRPLQKDIQKAGLRVTKSGKNITLANPKTGKKVNIKDNGKTLQAQRMRGNDTDGKADVLRGAASELQKEIDYLKEK